MKPYDTHPHADNSQTFKNASAEAFRVLSLPVDRGGCGWYRVRQILLEMDSQGVMTHILDPGDSEADLQQALTLTDVIMARNGTKDFVELIKARYPEKPIIFDHDDNTFDIQASNEHYRHHGQDDVIIANEKTKEEIPLWVTGVTHDFNRHTNRKKVLDLRYLLEESTLNTAPTELLAAKWGEYNGRAAVVPNCINFDWYPDINVTDPKKGDEIRIGWQGGVSHAGDFEEIGPGVASLLKKNKNAVYFSIGSFYSFFFKGVDDKQIRIYPWVDFQAHSYRMKSLSLDVAIIPLQDLEFNDFKSEIKFSEFAALKIPCLVRDRSPYKEVVKDGETGLLYDTKEEFAEKLKELTQNKKLRDKLAKNAYEWVREKRDLKKWTPKIIELYQSLLKKEEKSVKGEL